MELNVILLCFTVAICTYALLSKSNPDWNPIKILGNQKFYSIAVMALFLVAVAVRVWHFGSVPSGLNQDEAMAAADANALAGYGTDRFGTRLPVYFEAWGYGQMSVLLSYCIAPFIRIFGLTPVSIRLPMLLASLAGVYVLFRFAYRAFGRMPALVVLFFVAINPWQIMQSRWSLDCNMLPHFLLFSVYFLYIGLEKKAYLYLSMVFFALTMYSYGIAFYSIPLLLLALCIYLLIKKRIRPWEAAAAALIYFLCAWPIFAVVIINYFKLPTLKTGFITMQYFSGSIRMNDLIIYSKDFFNQLSGNLRSMADMTVLEKGDFNWNFIAGYGHMYLFTLPFVIVGLWYLTRRSVSVAKRAIAPVPVDAGPSDGTARYILWAWLAVSVFSGLMVNNVNTNRINIIYYPMILLASLGIWHVLFRAAPVKKIAIAVAVLYALSFAGFTAAYFGEHSKALANDFCSGLTDAVKYADGLDADVLYITADSRSEEAYTCSEIYTLIGADVDARYFQGVAQAKNRTTGKQLLPYKTRYQYIDFLEFTFDKPVGSVYVFNRDESDLFDPAEYDIKEFGNFSVAVKVQEIEIPADDEEPAG